MNVAMTLKRHKLFGTGLAVCAALTLLLMMHPAATAGERTFELTISRGHLDPAQDTIRVTQGDMVRFIWSSDKAVEVHLHGYDLLVDVPPGEPVEQQFEAHASGRFPVSLHDSGSGHDHGPLVYLEVYPD